MNTEMIIEEMSWDVEDAFDNDALVAAIELDILHDKAELHRLSDNDEQDDILLM